MSNEPYEPNAFAILLNAIQNHIKIANAELQNAISIDNFDVENVLESYKSLTRKVEIRNKIDALCVEWDSLMDVKKEEHKIPYIDGMQEKKGNAMKRSPKEWRELLASAGDSVQNLADILDDWESQTYNEHEERQQLLEDIMKPFPNDLLKNPDFKLALHTFVQYAILQDEVGIVESAKIISKLIYREI